jgi:hypothetical protein
MQISRMLSPQSYIVITNIAHKLDGYISVVCFYEERASDAVQAFA